MNVSLTQQLERFVALQVESGRYTSSSEVVRAALRLLQEQDEDRQTVRAAIHKGLGDARRGKLLDGEAVFAKLEKSISRPRRARKAG